MMQLNFIVDKKVLIKRLLERKLIENKDDTDKIEKFYLETLEYKNKIEKYYKEQERFLKKYFKNVIKFDKSIKLQACIVHPKCRIGNSADGIVTWGHYKGETDPDYNVTYLVHESLHHMLPHWKTMELEEFSTVHAIIELATDYELYTRLEGKSKDVKGHKDLSSAREEIYPYWINFLNLTKEEIKKRNLTEYYTKEHKDELKNMSLEEFVEFCRNEYKMRKEAGCYDSTNNGSK